MLYTTTLLEIVSITMQRLGLDKPTLVVGNTDRTVGQFLALANEEGEDLSSRHRWATLQKEATFTSVAANLQVALETLVSDFDRLRNGTMWDRTANRRVYPIDDRGWQLWKSAVATGPYPRFRIWQGGIYFIPVPTAGHTIAFEYQSNQWAVSSNGTAKGQFTADDDVTLIDPTLMKLGLRWRFLAAKGLEYSQFFDQYETNVADSIARDGSPGVLNMGGDSISDTACPQVTEGSWTL